MTINEEAFSKAVMAAAPLGFVSTTQLRKAIKAYEQAKKPETALVQKLVDVLRSGKIKAEVNFPILTVCPPIDTRRVFIEDALKALTEAEAWLKEQGAE